MDKQLREILEKHEMTGSYISGAKRVDYKHYDENAKQHIVHELGSFINDNYVSKDKLQELYKTGLEFEAEIGMAKKGNEYSAQFLDNILKAIDTLVSVPTPESLVYDL